MKNVIITGASRGIGLELAKIFSKQYNVYALCRKPSEALLKLEHVVVIPNVDLKSWITIDQAVKKCPDKIHLIINAAGILDGGSAPIGKLAAKSIQEQFVVNAMAPLFLVQSALDKLQKSAKVVMITSRMGSMGDNTSGGYYGYRMSKAAMNAMAVSLSIDLRQRGIAIGLLHPGFVRTQMTGYAGQYTPEESAELLAGRINQLTLENSGEFRHARGEVLPW